MADNNTNLATAMRLNKYAVILTGPKRGKHVPFEELKKDDVFLVRQADGTPLVTERNPANIWVATKNPYKNETTGKWMVLAKIATKFDNEAAGRPVVNNSSSDGNLANLSDSESEASGFESRLLHQLREKMKSGKENVTTSDE